MLMPLLRINCAGPRTPPTHKGPAYDPFGGIIRWIPRDHLPPRRATAYTAPERVCGPLVLTPSRTRSFAEPRAIPLFHAYWMESLTWELRWQWARPPAA